MVVLPSMPSLLFVNIGNVKFLHLLQSSRQLQPADPVLPQNPLLGSKILMGGPALQKFQNCS